jgi:hypothetical protein
VNSANYTSHRRATDPVYCSTKQRDTRHVALRGDEPVSGQGDKLLFYKASDFVGAVTGVRGYDGICVKSIELNENGM